MKDEFSIIWGRITSNEGQNFKTRSGLIFTYRTDNEGLRTSRTNYLLARSDFQKAYEILPIESPTEIKELVRGSSYIWAILHDSRISRGKW